MSRRDRAAKLAATLTIWLQLSAGHGPPECTWVVPRLAAALLTEASAAGLGAELLAGVQGDHPDTLRSQLIELTDSGADSGADETDEGPADGRCEAFAAAWCGSVLWVGRSPFRPEHRRRNWFVQVTRIAVPVDDDLPEPRPEELEISAMRSTGAGGQNVNKRSTAIRVRHRPTGITVVARDERSQAANRRTAVQRLAWLLRAIAASQRDAGQRAQWDAKGQVERGNPRRVFRGPDFVPDTTRS